MHGIRPKVGRRGGAKIGWVGRLLELAEKPSIANGKKHVELDITKKVISIILVPTNLCHPLLELFHFRPCTARLVTLDSTKAPVSYTPVTPLAT